MQPAAFPVETDMAADLTGMTEAAALREAYANPDSVTAEQVIRLGTSMPGRPRHVSRRRVGKKFGNFRPDAQWYRFEEFGDGEWFTNGVIVFRGSSDLIRFECQDRRKPDPIQRLLRLKRDPIADPLGWSGVKSVGGVLPVVWFNRPKFRPACAAIDAVFHDFMVAALGVDSWASADGGPVAGLRDGEPVGFVRTIYIHGVGAPPRIVLERQSRRAAA